MQERRFAALDFTFSPRHNAFVYLSAQPQQAGHSRSRLTIKIDREWQPPNSYDVVLPKEIEAVSEGPTLYQQRNVRVCRMVNNGHRGRLGCAMAKKFINLSRKKSHIDGPKRANEMSSFFNNPPPMFDIKKRLGTAPSTEKATDEDSMPESWVELAPPSRTSLCSSVEAVMIDRDGVEGMSSKDKDSRLSPVSLQSPHVEFETNLEQVKCKLVKDMLPPGKNTDWIWDWSSRPEAVPPKMLRHRSGQSSQQVGSTLTTPPNSPEPELSSEFEFKYRREKSPKKPVFLRFDVIFGLVVSNLMTFVLGATLGFYICKRLIKSEDAEPLELVRWDSIKW